MNDVTEWQQFYDDDANSFTYVSLTNIQKEYYGLEWGLKYKITPSLSIRTLGTISDAKYVNNCDAVYMNSTEGTYHNDIVYNKNMREGGTPLSAFNLTLSYNSGGWFIDVIGNYYDRIYLSYSPTYRYGKTLENRQKVYENTGIKGEQVFDIVDGKKVILDRALEQAKGKGGFMLDLSIGKSIRMRKGQLSINLSLTNVLNNRKLVTGGFEQSRSNYSYGINGMLNLSYRF